MIKIRKETKVNKNWKEILTETKSQLKGLLNENSSQEQINAITSLDKQLDSLNEVYDQKEKEVNSLKDNLIDMVKNTSFKVDNSSNSDIIDQNPKSMDEILMEELKKFNAK